MYLYDSMLETWSKYSLDSHEQLLYRVQVDQDKGSIDRNPVTMQIAPTAANLVIAVTKAVLMVLSQIFGQRSMR